MTAATLPAEIDAATISHAVAVMHLRVLHERMAEADAVNSPWFPMSKAEVRALMYSVETTTRKDERNRIARMLAENGRANAADMVRASG